MLSKPHPQFVLKNGLIMAWQDVPEIYQKKILEGTMTNEDWEADWYVPVRKMEDVVSPLLNDVSPVARHIHVWRKEYRTCMIKGCNGVRE